MIVMVSVNINRATFTITGTVIVIIIIIIIIIRFTTMCAGLCLHPALQHGDGCSGGRLILRGPRAAPEPLPALQRRRRRPRVLRRLPAVP